MPIRKTGAVGSVIEIEDDGLITKTAAADTGWGADDEDELTVESSQE